MKTLFYFIIILLCQQFSYATGLDLYIPKGTYSFINKVDLLKMKEFEKVDTITEKGKQRLKELRIKGWICVALTSQQQECSNFEKNSYLPEELNQKIINELEFKSIDFAYDLSTELTNQSESLIEYNIFQKVKLNNSIITQYKMQVLEKKLIKFQLKELSTNYYFNLNENNLNIDLIKNYIQVKGNKKTVYLVALSFAKI